MGLRVFGAVPRQAAIELPERHLGLVQAAETDGLNARLDALADLAETNLDIDALLGLSPSNRSLDFRTRAALAPPPAQRIALARDAAFSFIYPHILKGWREAGAEIGFFSPLNDEAPDAKADLVWLPGGYPELHAGRLASNARFLDGIRQFARDKPVHGECGGYMVLGSALTDAAGERHPMLGLLGLETSFAARKLHLGYREARLLADCALGKKGEAIAGHEFHYATVLNAPGEELFSLSDADGNPLVEGGSRRGQITGSFFHFVDRR